MYGRNVGSWEKKGKNWREAVIRILDESGERNGWMRKVERERGMKGRDKEEREVEEKE